MENFFLDSEMNIKLADFGLATKKDSLLTEKCGTLSYKAPEVDGKTTYKGIPVDVFSLGVILYLMLAFNFHFSQAMDKKYKNLFKDP